MNWTKQNAFLTGFIAVVLIGAGVLVYFIFKGMGSYDEAAVRYAALVGEFGRMQALPLSANEKNLATLVGQKEEAIRVVTAFQKSLAAKSFPFEPMSPEKFQDTLKAARNTLVERSQGTMKMPAEKFFLGFESYETRPPDSKETAALLGHQLKAIEWLFSQLIDNRVTLVKSFKRDPLPEEIANPPKGVKKPKALMSKHPVEIAFQCQQNSLAPLLNKLVSPEAPQFYTLRFITVKNQAELGPKRTINLPAPALPGGQPPVRPPDSAVKYIVGEEQLEVTMQIEIVDFADPTLAPAR